MSLTALISLMAMSFEPEKKDKDRARGIFITGLIGVALSLYLYVKDNNAKNELISTFKLSQDLYCHPSQEAKSIKVNRGDGWYLEDDILKNKTLGYVIYIESCSKEF
jgi:hypothetical protein